MNQIQIPFSSQIDIPKSHLYALQVCNNAVNWSEKQSFYTFKKHN
jgi:hypothetical protein